MAEPEVRRRRRGIAVLPTMFTLGNLVSGFFAIVIGLLAWISLVAQLFLLAAEINVVRARRLHVRPETTRCVDDAAHDDHRAATGFIGYG